MTPGVANNAVSPTYVNGMTDIKLDQPVSYPKVDDGTQTLSGKEKVVRFLKKYLCEGQKFNEKDTARVEEIPEDADWFDRFGIKHRKLLAFVIPPTFMWCWWWAYTIAHNNFYLFKTRYELPLVMAFGSFIGGMTCEGSGAVAFPIMTLLLHINPTVARDFAVMIQSCGMTSASFTILFMRVALEWHSIIFCSIGATFGIIIGIEFVDPLMTKAQKKMFFVSIWFAFACALFLLNTQKKRKTYLTIQLFTVWKAGLLVATGLVGGILTSFAGTGVCICSFSILTLVFSISEKIATQTSIILMAGNTLIAFFWRAKINGNISDLAWEYWKCTVPVSVIVGPLGAFVGSYVHRQTLAWAVYILELIALIGGFVIVKPGWMLTAACIAIVAGGFAFFFFLSKLGLYLLGTYPDAQVPNGMSNARTQTSSANLRALSTRPLAVDAGC